MITIYRSFKISTYALLLIIFNVFDFITTYFFINKGMAAEYGPVLYNYYELGGLTGVAIGKLLFLLFGIFLLECMLRYYKYKRARLVYTLTIIIVAAGYIGGIGICHYFDIR